MFGTISRKLGPWLAALMAILGFGVLKKRQGRKEAEHATREADHEMAQKVSRRAEMARERSADDDRTSDERLRERGALRDE